MLIRAAELAGAAAPLDVRIEGGRVAAIAPRLARRHREACVDAGGAALLPGLHDHHLHLFALAASRHSLDCGPARRRDAAALADAIARAPGDHEGWVRGVGYHDSVAGPLSREMLDALCRDRPLRIQHRSGALWGLNSRAIAALGLDADDVPPSVERDAAGRATGRLFGQDAWLRDRRGAATPPDLREVGRLLARYGVTGVTDASADNGPRELAAFASAQASGALPQRLIVMGGASLLDAPSLGARRDAPLGAGARKLLLREAFLPPFDELERAVRGAHADGRNVAVHCVTRAELLLACAVFEAAGCLPGDRIEHASIAQPDALSRVAALPLCVVTQPNFLYERGDNYREDVDPSDLRWLYRGRGFLAAGVPLGGGTDAPFGDPDPWRAMAAAVDRETRSGARLSPEESLTPEEALALFSTSPFRPGGLPRRIAAGGTADLVLLDRPWRAARASLSSSLVAATWRGGELLWQRDGSPASQ